MKPSALRAAANVILSMEQSGGAFFVSIGSIPNDNIWRGLLRLLIRQSNGENSRICDVFPQDWLSDRTRIFYARQMLKNGMLVPILTELNLETDIALSQVTTKALVGILDQYELPYQALA